MTLELGSRVGLEGGEPQGEPAESSRVRKSKGKILRQLTSAEVLDSAYEWLYKRRENYPDNAEIWSFRFRWKEEKEKIRADLRAGRYRFSLLKRVTVKSGEAVDLWSSRDALVLKALAVVLIDHLPVSSRCTHLKGHGGGKGAVRAVWEHLEENRFVLRTDVKSYYASIDHFLIDDQLRKYIKGPPSLESPLAISSPRL